MRIKKTIKTCLIIIPVLLLFLSLFYWIIIYPIATSVELSILTKNFPKSRALKFIPSFVLDDSSHSWEWGTFELDKKCFDFNYDTDYWTIKGHDNLVFSVGMPTLDCDIAEIGGECVLPTDINTDVFKAIGISEYNTFFNMDDGCKSLSVRQNNTIMLNLSTEEIEKILDIICLNENFNIIFHKSEFYPQKVYYVHLYMDENDNIFRFAPYPITLAFDGEQWKFVFGASKDSWNYVADVPFDTSMLSACE